MNSTVRQLAAAGLLLAASATALADVTQANVDTAQASASLTGAAQGTTAFSSLVFVAYNVDGTFSMVQSLGLKGTAPTVTTGTGFGVANTDGNGLALTLNFDVSNALLAANAGTLRWGVYAYDTLGDPTLAAGQWRFITTVNTAQSNLGDITSYPTTQTVAAGGATVTSFLSQNPSTSPVTVSVTPGEVNNWTEYEITNLTQTVATTTTATNTLAMYVFSNQAAIDISTPTVGTLYAGTWSLDAALGTLTYSVSAVPLPAAAWLLMSALGGLGVVGRRRKPAVAA